MFRYQRSLRVISLGLLCLFALSTAVHAEEEVIEQSAQMSVSVVKADFSNTIWTVTLLERDLYEVDIRVPNTGSYDAENVRVELSSLMNMRYISSTASTEYELFVDESRPRKIVQWVLPKIAIGEAVEIQATFESAQSLDQLGIYVAVESDVSAPVAVQTDTGGPTANEDEVTQEGGDASVVDRAWEWTQRMVRSLAKFLNGQFERLADWVTSVL